MNRLNINKKRMTSAGLAAALALTAVPGKAFAAEENTEKEEVVYINLAQDGSVNEINVVNIFDLKASGTITDYGNYESVRNMTSTDTVNQSGDTITIEAGNAGKLYYEGKLTNNQIPWNIGIHYYMDGTEYSGEEIAGMSGHLKMTMKITQSASDSKDFFENYALQASLTLDTDQCSNIEAPDATIANVGSDKQLTYTILPGKGADVEIEADVTDFEMESIAINGIPLNLNIEVDDEELMDQVTELLDAIEEIDDGTGELNDGVGELQNNVEDDLQSGVSELNSGAKDLQSGSGELKDGGTTLKSGAQTLSSGADELDSGMQSLNNGIAQVQAGLDALNAQSSNLTEGSAQMKAALVQLQTALNSVSASAEDLQKITAASASIKTGIDDLTAGAKTLEASANYEAYKAVMAQNGLDIDQLKAGNTAAIESLNSMLSQVQTIESMLTAMGIPQESIAPLEAQCTALATQITTLLNGNNAAIDGTEAYLNSLSAGAASLTDGAESLQTSYAQFDAAICELTNSMTNMLYQMTQLKDAVNALVAAYGDLDDGLNAYTDGVAKVVAGYSQVSDGAGTLAGGTASLKEGSSSLYSGTKDLLNGIVQLYDATGTLTDGTGELDEGVAELIAGIAELSDGSSKLKDGTGELRDETSDIDTEIEDKIDEMLETITGSGADTVSFVSDQNTNIDMVQFVITTEAISTQEVEDSAVTEEKSMNTWEKLLNLFGLYDEE